MDNIAKTVGMAQSAVYKYIKTLVAEGRLAETPGNRGCKPVEEPTTVNLLATTKVQRVGYISCGGPLTEEQTDYGYSDIPNIFLADGEYFFLLKANGDSMIGAEIEDGDDVMVRVQQDAKEGDIVVALTDNNESTLKRIHFDKENNKVVLHPENDAYEDIVCDKVIIQGVATQVIKRIR